MSSSSYSTYPWAERFSEIALRALRRVHFDYGAIHVGQQWTAEAPELAELNHGIGVAAADELTVCAAIAQECLLSPFFSGAWAKGDGQNVREGQRYWSINRERMYLGTQERADFVITRIPGSGETELANENQRDCYIEAKRLRRWTTKSLSRPDFKAATPSFDEVAKDITKLRAEMKVRGDAIRGHVLLWDIYEPGWNGIQSLENIFNVHPLSKLTLHQLKWLPIDWRSGIDKEPPKVKKWLWIALLEVPLDDAASAPQASTKRETG